MLDNLERYFIIIDCYFLSNSVVKWKFFNLKCVGSLVNIFYKLCIIEKKNFIYKEI